MKDEITLKTSDEAPPLQIGLVAYDDLTLLDLVGPHTVFSLAGRSHIIARSLEPVMSDSGVAIVPTCTYADCPQDLDVLLVPGGRGAVAAMRDSTLLAFLQARESSTRFLTAVCSGPLVLAAAGLLRGYKSTSHWGVLDVLAEFDGVEAVSARVVVDRNRISGGGVTAGIDFGLTLLRELRGEHAAKLNQLLMEYDPQPPMDAGSPESAGEELAMLGRTLLAPYHAAIVDAARASVGARPIAHAG